MDRATAPPTVLLTRSAAQNSETIAALRALDAERGALGVDYVAVATSDLAPVPPSAAERAALLAALARADAVAVTSRAALDAAVALDLRDALAGAPCGLAVVGAASAHRAEALGLRAAIVADPPTATGLAATLSARFAAAGRASAEVVWLAGDRALPDLGDALTAAGHRVRRCVLYHNAAVPLPDAPPPADVVVFHAPSAAERLLAVWPALASRPCVAIGPTTAEALRSQHGVRRVHVAQAPTPAALADAIALALDGGDP